MSEPVRAVFGLPLYNGQDHLREALESVLCQSRRDFAIVMADDGSTDATPEIAREYAAADARLTSTVNARRLGVIANWRHVFALAQEQHPEAEYFAWLSDHDLWHPHWLARLVARLDENPEAVLAYPLNTVVDEAGRTLRQPWVFDTAGIASPWERLTLACRGMAAGSMVYGLFRAPALKACGVYRPVIVPDRLLMSELALRGEMLQVQEVLWHRRQLTGVSPSVPRQRASFFPGRRPPLYSYLPWSVTHVGALVGTLVLRGEGRPAISRARGAAVTARYAWLAAIVQVRSSTRHRVSLIVRPLIRRLRRVLDRR